MNAQRKLGNIYHSGDSFYQVQQDYDEAAKWYRKAAEQGDAAAQSEMGDFISCAMMGGRIWLESESGRGPTFLFTVPVKPSAGQPKDDAARNARILAGVAVLGVDDNATNQRLLANRLRGWGMSPAISGAAALALLKCSIDLRDHSSS